MTRVLLRLGFDLCDEVERFARAASAASSKRRATDLAAATVAARARRLRAVLTLIENGSVDADAPHTALEYALAITRDAEAWRSENADADAHSEGALRLVEERALLFSSLLRKSDARGAREVSATRSLGAPQR